MSEPVLLEREGAVAIVTLNRPEKRNVLDTSLREALYGVLGACLTDAAVRVVVLTANGDFCAGGALETYGDITVVHARRRLQESHRILRALIEGPKPVVAAVEGAAIGAGTGLALACDHIVAGASACFSPSSARFAAMPDWALLFTLPRRIGFAKSRELFLFGGAVEAGAALQMSLVDAVVPEGRARAAAVERANRLADFPPLAVKITKAAVNGLDQNLESVLHAELEGQPYLFRSQDFREAVSAFKERRPPEFQGK